MHHLLLITPTYSYRTSAYIQAAKEMDLRVSVVSDGESPLAPASTPGFQFDFSNWHDSVDGLIDYARRQSIDAVLGTDDVTVAVASAVGGALGLAVNPVEAVALTHRKDLARQRLRECDLAVPEFDVLPIPLAAGTCSPVGYPCVLKPVSLSGSRGVIRANNRDEFVEAALRIEAIVAELPDPEVSSLLLVEQYVHGDEAAMEGFIVDGKLDVTAVFDKPDPLHGPFFEETIYVAPSRLGSSALTKATELVQQAVEAYGLFVGPVHAEFRVCDDEVYLIELAARTIGGECARVLQFDGGASLETLVLEAALGRLKNARLAQQAFGVMMIPTPANGSLRRVEGLLDARKIEHVDDIILSVREGYVLRMLPEASSYLGFIFASGPSAEVVENAIRAAHAKLRIVVEPVWQLEQQL